TIVSGFPQTRKNSSGYALDAFLRSGDSLDLVIGAEGTLGFVTDVEWRLDQVPPCRAGLRVTLHDYDSLTVLVRYLVELGASAVELLDRTFLDLVATHSAELESVAGRQDVEAVLLVELEASNTDELRDRVEAALRAARDLAIEADAALSAEGSQRLWALRH